MLDGTIFMHGSVIVFWYKSTAHVIVTIVNVCIIL